MKKHAGYFQKGTSVLIRAIPSLFLSLERRGGNLTVHFSVSVWGGTIYSDSSNGGGFSLRLKGSFQPACGERLEVFFLYLIQRHKIDGLHSELALPDSTSNFVT